MKLEFESNAVSSPLVSNEIPAEFDAEHVSPELIQTLRDGIKAAQDGDQAKARNLLLRVTEADPKNESAWLWLASISEYPEELLVFLNNVLEINPDNERALEWAKATKSLIAKTFVQRGIDASKEDQKKFAKQCFLQAIVHDADSELAWLWLASVTDSNEEKMNHLQKVLSINPENENALSSLKNAKRQVAKLKLPKANAAAISGDRETANEILAEIFAESPEIEDAWMLQAHISESFNDKIAAFERVLEINPENPVARANVESLKMFAAENSDSEGDAVVPNDFDHSMSGEDIRFEPGPDRVTEAYDSLDSSDMDVQYHEEEAVSFEAVEPTETESVETKSDVIDLFEEEDLMELEGSLSEVLDDEPEASEDSANVDEDAVSFYEESEGADEQVDHDYVADGVDAQSEEEARGFELTDESADFTSEEIAEFEADDESHDSNQEEAEAAFDSADTEEAIESDVEAGDDTDVDETAALFESGDEEAFDDTDDEASFDSAQSEDTAEDASYEAEADMSSEDLVDEEPEAGFDSAEEEREAHSLESAESEPDYTSEPAMPNFDTDVHSSQELPVENALRSSDCPYCDQSNENQAFACHNCKAIFTISDIEMILSHKKADTEVISKALQKMESNKTLRGVDVEELKHLGIGYINLKDFRKGFEYLQDAAKKDPNDVVLISQIDALAIRLAEIEEHERDHEPVTRGKRILVVDDSPTVRKLISGKLEKCGHEAICAVDGMDALAKINEVIPDLILLDITMPRMDGYQVCKLIRGNDATKDVPVVMISGKDGFFDKVRGRMAGTSNYITKPFGPETLMKTVNEYVQ